jgi:hypothetical protein
MDLVKFLEKNKKLHN